MGMAVAQHHWQQLPLAQTAASQAAGEILSAAQSQAQQLQQHHRIRLCKTLAKPMLCRHAA
jgi:hypothetical protein